MSLVNFNSIMTPPINSRFSSDEISNKTAKTEKSFSDVFNEALNSGGSVKFSKHALTRLEQRNIKLDGSDLQKLTAAVDSASQKGVKDSLVLMGGLAFIVSVKDRTVVTAMPNDEAVSNVFTNIDGAVIV